MYIILNKYNELKCEGRFDTTSKFKFTKRQTHKRTANEVNDYEDE